MHKPFEFEDGGRTYSCHVEKMPAVGDESWWWFTVSGDSHRYAPFHAAKSDTRDSVRTRILAYYIHLQERRAEPAAVRQHWARRGKDGAPNPNAQRAAKPDSK